MRSQLIIKKSSILQYTALYLMLIINQTNLYMKFFDGRIVLTLILGFAAILLVKARKRCISGFVFLILMLMSVIFVRVMTGGVGINFWYEIAIKVLVVYVAIIVDEVHFFDRYVKLVSLLAGISLVFFAFQLGGLNLAKIFFSGHNTSYINVTYDYQGNRFVSNYLCYGTLLYSYLTYYPNRNVGIFTEPGIYQMVLNSAIFVLVFWNERLFCTDKTRKRMFILLTVALISTQSTTGYIGFFAILVSLLFSRSKRESQLEMTIDWKKQGLRVLMAAVVGLGLDMIVRGEQSFLFVSIIKKLFTETNQFSLTAENSTGQYRVASIVTAIQAMITHPFGLGYDGWESFSVVNALAGAGGWPLKLGAILGVFPFIVLLFYLFYPLRKMDKATLVKWLYVFLYFNTCLAQSSAVYPVLIMFSVYQMIVKNISLGGRYNNE